MKPHTRLPTEGPHIASHFVQSRLDVSRKMMLDGYGEVLVVKVAACMQIPC